MSQKKLAIIADQLDIDGGTENYISRLLNHLPIDKYQPYLFILKKEYIAREIPNTVTVLEYENKSRFEFGPESENQE